MTERLIPAQMDVEHLVLVRESVETALRVAAEGYGAPATSCST